MPDENSVPQPNAINTPRKILKRLPKFGSNRNPNLIRFQLPRRINYDDKN